VFLSADAFTAVRLLRDRDRPEVFPDRELGFARTREYGAMKLVLYSFAGSALVLAGLLWAYAAGGGRQLCAGGSRAAAAGFRGAEQIVMFALVFTGFAVLAGMFPFHTWAPTGHVAAPTAASMLLAGVVMKLGAYGCLRVAMPMFPAGLEFWQPAIAGSPSSASSTPGWSPWCRTTSSSSSATRA
jgi:NADH-quinone oxidoreductase subunit M